MPGLLGADDDPSGFSNHHDRITAAPAGPAHLRLGATGAVWDVLLGVVLEQQVTGVEARRSWRELAWRFGAVAPGPVPAGLRLPPDPVEVLAIPDWRRTPPGCFCWPWGPNGETGWHRAAQRWVRWTCCSAWPTGPYR